MLGEHHDLGTDFPEYKEKIHQLKTSNRHFAHLFDEYQKVNNEIYRVEEQIETTSDKFAEELKSKRVKLKDELFQMLKTAK